MRTRRSFDELCVDAYSAPSLAHTAFEYISHSQLASDLLYVDSSAFVSEARIAGDHEQRVKARQFGDDLLDDAVGEILLLRVARHIGERQDRDRRFVRKRH